MKNTKKKQQLSFAFGKNWAEYAEKIGDAEINAAADGLSRLLGNVNLNGKRFLDIGCGSGVHSLAALGLGASEVNALDIDPVSVATTREVIRRYNPKGKFKVEQLSILDLDPMKFGKFDVVYSWGVLHHTGNLHRAIHNAASLVADSGIFIFALYRKTWSCWLWQLEKRWYAHTSTKGQHRARALYILAFKMRLLISGHKFSHYSQHYHKNRGMDYYHDVHDWLGGWPYESISPENVKRVMNELNFSEVRSFVSQGRYFGRNPGIFGSGCDEYVYKH